ncbi:exosortase A [Noviherbaspirillum pedocola]|uniref:Exosortase A n=1 Tax=Noviherbaspirillum pedocola TaxID=2801341 RepID=A0A934W4V6_9BURK|nr:exosortase A [Noviherbaspirillum pedocola]MBK4734277.1 exosortase A [Noviherbaspirillum pedocola]
MLLTETRAAPRDLLKTLAIALAVLAPFFLYFGTVRTIVATWDSSETFAHGYAILPISLWLIWKRRAVLARLSPEPFWPALLLLAACGFGWLLAELADVQVVRQYAFVAMLPLTVLAVCGRRVAWSIAFPLLFLLFAVPFGEVFIEPLINFTADFTVWALQLTGIPVLREGSSFSIPSGNWSVVEACSGVRYLIASVTLGCLYAYLSYRSRARQLLFVVVSVLVPIVANGMRAYMIVMIGHLSSMRLATGVDHIIYGWLFFGLVMFIMFWIGNRWREDVSAEAEAEKMAATTPIAAGAASGQVALAAIATIACMAVWPLYAKHTETANAGARPVSLASFHSTWTSAPRMTAWQPHLNAGAAAITDTLQQNGKTVGLEVHYYRAQPQGTGLISSVNRLTEDLEDSWRRIGAENRVETVNGRSLAVKETRLRGADGTLVVWQWYWIDGRFTTNDYLGKVLQARERLFMRGDDGASILTYARFREQPEEARAAMRAFLASNLPSLEATLATNRKD